MALLIDLWWWWLTRVENEVKNYSRRLGRNLKELALKTLTFYYIDIICNPNTKVRFSVQGGKRESIQ